MFVLEGGECWTDVFASDFTMVFVKCWNLTHGFLTKAETEYADYYSKTVKTGNKVDKKGKLIRPNDLTDEQFKQIKNRFEQCHTQRSLEFQNIFKYFSIGKLGFITDASAVACVIRTVMKFSFFVPAKKEFFSSGREEEP